MKHRKWVITLLILMLSSIIIVGVSTVEAENRDRAAVLPRSIMDSGGTGGTAGVYEVRSSLGQPVIGQVAEVSYKLRSGFWGYFGEIFLDYLIFMPLIER